MTEPTLSGALDALVGLLGGLSVDFDYIQSDGTPVPINPTLSKFAKIQRVYPLPPDVDSELESPCWVTSWNFETDQHNPQGLAIATYQAMITLYISEGPELGLLTAIATHFHDALLPAIRANLRLVDGNGVIQATNETQITGGDPTLAMYPWNGKWYVGLRYQLSFDQWQAATYG